MIHLQDLLTSRDQMSGQINVEVDAAPQEDLTKILAEMREHYETVVAKSQRDLEGWFQQKVGWPLDMRNTTLIKQYRCPTQKCWK